MVVRRSMLVATSFLALAVFASQAQKPTSRPPAHHTEPAHHSAPEHHSSSEHHSSPQQHHESRPQAFHRGPARQYHSHVVVRADHSRVVAQYGHRGYVEHPYSYRGHDFYRRSVYSHGRYVGVRYYRGYSWHGYGLHVWAPGIYFSRGFYGWAYHPWRTHVYYRWGWYSAPWYGSYGYYFQPYSSYAGASEWLTDYTISQDLSTGYDAQPGEAAPPPEAAGGPDPNAITSDTKASINDEIEYELSVENGEADLTSASSDVDAGSSGIPRLFADSRPHVFVVSGPIDVTMAGSADQCTLSNGDVIRTTTPPAADDKNATLTVIASKRGEDQCAKASNVLVSLDDLQEMQNNLRQTVHDGLTQLQQEQGKNGIPALPAAAAGPTSTPQYAELAPPPDPNDGAAVEQQMSDGDGSPAPQQAPSPAETQAPAPIERR
jgi:hypothetical protein